MATMKRLLHDAMPIHGQEQWLAPDEMELLLEALHSYSRSSDGKRHSGRLTWLREKLVFAKREGAALRLYQS